AGLTPQLLRGQGLTEMPLDGIHAVTVPGAVAGWAALHARFGHLPMRDLLAPAVFYADHGFPVTDIIASRWAAFADKLSADPGASRTYLPAGRAPRAGEIFTNRDLAASIRRLSAGGRTGLAVVEASSA